MPHKLTDILHRVAGAGAAPDMAISGLNADSQLIGQGEVFFALPGTRGHGNIYGKDAAGRGAVAMVTDLAPKADPGIPVVVVDDVRAAYAVAAANFLSLIHI